MWNAICFYVAFTVNLVTIAISLPVIVICLRKSVKDPSNRAIKCFVLPILVSILTLNVYLGVLNGKQVAAISRGEMTAQQILAGEMEPKDFLTVLKF